MGPQRKLAESRPAFWPSHPPSGLPHPLLVEPVVGMGKIGLLRGIQCLGFCRVGTFQGVILQIWLREGVAFSLFGTVHQLWA
jgi:hypothetical protein